MVYNRLPEDRRAFAFGCDFTEMLEEFKASFSSGNNNLAFYDYLYEKDFSIVTININGMVLKLVFFLLTKCNTKGTIAKLCRNIPILHHGVLIICDENVTPSSVEWCPTKINEPWGCFCTNNYTHVGRLIHGLPISKLEHIYNESETFCICLKNIKCTQDLYYGFSKMIDTIDKDKNIQFIIKDIYDYINNSLKRWMKTSDRDAKSISFYEPNLGNIILSNEKVMNAFKALQNSK